MSERTREASHSGSARDRGDGLVDPPAVVSDDSNRVLGVGRFAGGPSQSDVRPAAVTAYGC